MPLLGLAICVTPNSHAWVTSQNEKPGMRIIILGAPGAGKGTQADRLAKQYHIPHISTGDLLRTEITKRSHLGLIAKEIMASGQLLSDDIIFSMLKERLKNPDCANGFILDGYPRTIAQAEQLKTSHITIDRIIEIKIDDREVINRISGRRVHQPSGRVYHLTYNPPKKPGFDDLTGQPLVQREDDRAEIVKSRLEIYHRQTEPLIDYYEKWAQDHNESAPQLYKISGTGNPDQIFAKIVKSLNRNKRLT